MSDASQRQTSLEAFRRHRHDVLNQLQIIRALVQMDRPDRALAAIDRLAEWLQSLGQAQQAVPSGAESMVWTLACCPHVMVDLRVETMPGEGIASQWCSFLQELEGQLAVAGKRVRLKVTITAHGVLVDAPDDPFDADVWQLRYPQIQFVRG
ncbi:Spo0B domain-containing protein [Alicyclobacillus vulcanalis]|uniref:Sensor_kinase_SpoOB-type, alpha-helical domain n=2 Tax=Alicyclobacillus TaxID=29330 RepID=A0A1N7KPW8_9BACL|nr:Spo0B domain-containing protein [Alicyclobacillus vulcanalis]SIS63628.1 Sensor_kinase_SpoOB-type, alpha-helical domain [Alicyclobacillus vulcanalis]